MGKVRKGKILVIAILMMIASFFAFTGKAEAYYKATGLGFLSYVDLSDEYYSPEGSSSFWCGLSPKIHLYANGEELNFLDYGWTGTPRIYGARNSTGGPNCKPTSFILPESYQDADIFLFGS